MAFGELTDSPVTFLWEPDFGTWAAFGVRLNSSMTLLSPDLTRATELFFGFGEDEQQQVLDAAAQLRS